MKTLIFTATYNEVENISTLIKDCLSELPEAHILVVDDNSPDGTGTLLDGLKVNWSDRLHIIHRPRKLGLGTAHKLAMKYAVHNGYDSLITMDADYSHHPKYLKRMQEELKTADFVTASRYIAGGKCDYDWKRQILSRTANVLARNVLSIKLHETTTSYRGFNRALLQKLPLDQIKSTGYAFFFECIFYAARMSSTVGEFPIHFEDRRAGTSKISKKEILRSIVRLSQLGMQRVFNCFRKAALYEEGINADACDVCQSKFHVQLYAATGKEHNSDMYNCSSAHHSSHGRIVQCLECGLIATNPKVSESELTNLYTDVIDQVYIKNIPARVSTFEYNLNRILVFLPKGSKLLDVGSYYGVFLDVARRAGFVVTGIEPSRSACEFAEKTYQVAVHNGTLATYAQGDGEFDIVTSWDVMEHFYSPMKELRAINQKLKIGGIFAFSTLNWDNWYARMMGERWPWLMDMHVYYFDDKIMRDMLHRSGFELKLAESYCHIITFEYFIRKLASLGVPFMNFVNKCVIKTPLAKVQIPFRFGDIRMYVAVKIVN